MNPQHPNPVGSEELSEILDAFGYSIVNNPEESHAELRRKTESDLLAWRDRAVAEARVNGNIEALANILVHCATGKKRIGLNREAVVSKLAELQSTREELWESRGRDKLSTSNKEEKEV